MKNGFKVVLILLAIIVSVTLSEEKLFHFEDNFSSYKEGSDGFPAWLPLTYDWEIKKGEYCSVTPYKSFTIITIGTICTNTKYRSNGHN